MMGFLKSVMLPLNIAEHVIDNYVYDKVLPMIGSVVYCDFIASASIIQHSGIYVRGGNIIQLNSSGVVEKVSPEEFVSGWGGFKCGSSIYVSCEGVYSVGSTSAAELAESLVGMQYSYGITKFNCHQFVSGCLLGYVRDPDFVGFVDRVHSTLTGLKITSRVNLGSDNWRVWNR
ncbi:hypothetical protein LG301_10370 [Vreelandella venusta]|uniref:hypothetical protein n=1 Tax=Vreelandella venusta TaxID=44935 RepID=UPI00384CB1B4